eukprot:gene9536-9700_t
MQHHSFLELGGPVLVMFVSRHPEAMEPGLLEQVPVRLLLDLPSFSSREELLLSWLMDQGAAVGVDGVELLAR